MPDMDDVKALPRNAEAERQVMRQHFQAQREGRADEATQELLNEIAIVHQEMADRGTQPATIVNLNPFELHAQGPMLTDIVVPACTPGEAFAYAVVDSFKIDIQDKGGRYGARAVVPIALAKDFVAQQKLYGRGGVFCYHGSMKPGDKKLPDEYKRMMEKARDEMFGQCQQMVEQASAEWSRPNGAGKLNVDDRHRKAFLVLKTYKLWNKPDPEWASLSRNIEDVVPPCPSCGMEPIKGAFQCKVCAFIIDPVKAYQLGEIGPDHQSLRRLNKEQLQELGLYPTVLPLAEYQAAMLKRIKDNK